MSDLIDALLHKNIFTVLRRNSEGRLYGITFVDNQNKCVFNGSDLGKNYSAAAIQTRLPATLENILTKDKESSSSSSGQIQKENSLQKQQGKKLGAVKNESLIDLLLSPKEQFGNMSFLLLKRKRKKERKIEVRNYKRYNVINRRE